MKPSRKPMMKKHLMYNTYNPTSVAYSAPSPPYSPVSGQESGDEPKKVCCKKPRLVTSVCKLHELIVVDKLRSLYN